ncbi:MAG: extracellular solute-binding protein, partial [Anaerolineaceae bacterium]
MSKKFSVLAVILVLSMVLAACGTPAAAPTTEPTKAPEVSAASTCPYDIETGAVITFSGWGDESEQNVYKATIERFKTVCPEVTVNYTPIPADFQTKLKAQMAGGTAPDVFYVDDQLMTAFASSNQIMPLDDMMATAKVTREDFIPALLTIFTKDGKTYA